MSENIGRWSIGKKGCMIYHGIHPSTYLIKEHTGASLKIKHDKIWSNLYKEIIITAKQIWIDQSEGKIIQGTYEIIEEKKIIEIKWFTQRKIESDFAHGDEKGAIIYRICGPDKPKCEKHKKKEKGCKTCEYKKEDYYVSVSVINGKTETYPLYNGETTDVSGKKINIQGGGKPLRLEGKAFAFKNVEK